MIPFTDIFLFLFLKGHPKSRRNDGMTERLTEQQLANT